MDLRSGALAVLGVFLAFPAGSVALQDDPIPREFTAGSNVTLLYDVEDPSARGRAESKVGEIFLFGGDLVRPGFERFTEYQLEELPYEFLFQLPPPKIRRGRTWKVDVTLGARALAYLRGSDFCPRVSGGYGLVGIRKIKGTPLCVVKGKFDITDGRLQPLPTAAARKKAGQTATVKPTLRKIGALEVELRIRPDTGVLQEAFYHYQIKVRARAPMAQRNGPPVVRTGQQKLEHHRRVVLKEGPVEAEDVATRAREASERGLKILLTALSDAGTFDIPSNANGQRQLYLATLAARALRACGHPMDTAPIKAALDDLWSRAPQEDPSIVSALISLTALQFPVTLEEPLAILEADTLGPIDPATLPAGQAEAIETCLEKVAAGQSPDTGLWGRDLSGPRSAAAGGGDAQSVSSTTYALLGLHHAARLGWKVKPEVWSRVVPTLHQTAIPLGSDVAIDLTFVAGSPYKERSKDKKATPLAWARTPLSARRGDSPSSAEATLQVLVCAAIIRHELALAKGLDAAMEKALDEIQLGGLAWLAAAYTPWSLDTPGYAWNPARDTGAALGPVLCLYGVEKVGKRDPYRERSILLLRKQDDDGSWRRHRYAEPSFETTARSILELCRFTPRGW